jgi:hypothetical protein
MVRGDHYFEWWALVTPNDWVLGAVLYERIS